MMHSCVCVRSQRQHHVRPCGACRHAPSAPAARTPCPAAVRQIVLKSQIYAGGRGLGTFTNGLQGGVHIAPVAKALELAKQMLGQTLVTKQTGPGGKPVNTLYIARKMKLKREMYFAILLDRKTAGPVMIGCRWVERRAHAPGAVLAPAAMRTAGAARTRARRRLPASLNARALPQNTPSKRRLKATHALFATALHSEGGTSIEDLAEKFPEKIIKIPVDIRAGITDEQALAMARGLAVSGDLDAAAGQIKALYRLFDSCDCTMVEVRRRWARGAACRAQCACGVHGGACCASRRVAVLQAQTRPRAHAHGCLTRCARLHSFLPWPGQPAGRGRVRQPDCRRRQARL